ncbi:thiosulfate dehydrogenase [quinone] large subunit [Pedobacter sp. UYP30]|uniref:DoxX family protein n=1 Tax=Pedobacter sp. UYP30 TaxID=1756400 RepID=UPI003393CE7D
MKISEAKIIQWLLRISLSAGLLSAVADRFGFWSKELSAWGNWENFLAYTQKINPFVPASVIPFLGGVATFLEIGLGLALLTTYKTSLFAKATGFLLLLFGLSMAFSLNIKAPLDYSVFSASAGAFALSLITNRKSK